MEKIKQLLAQIPHPIVESVKELFRVVLLAVVPVIITMLENETIDYKVIAVVGAIAALRFVDKLLHETGKAEEKTTGHASRMTKGITRF